MKKHGPALILFAFILAGLSPDGSAQSFDNKRISTENFPGDQAIGITHILDPELSRAIGARGCRIWVQPNALEQADYYLRVSSHPNALGNNFDPALFQNDTLDAAVDVLIDEAMLLPGWGYVPGSQWFPRERVREKAQRLSDFDWDYFYERMVSCDVIGSSPSSSGILAPIPFRWFCRNEFDRYHGPNANRLREHLLEQRGIEARFINSVDNIRIREYTMKSKESPHGVASAFVFDSDPLGYQYRREEKNRVAQRNLQNINSSSTVADQWVRRCP